MTKPLSDQVTFSPLSGSDQQNTFNVAQVCNLRYAFVHKINLRSPVSGLWSLLSNPCIQEANPVRSTISIKDARENNLKNIDVELPRDKLIVLTGLSGSDKSSLAFETIYTQLWHR